METREDDEVLSPPCNHHRRCTGIPPSHDPAQPPTPSTRETENAALQNQGRRPIVFALPAPSQMRGFKIPSIKSANPIKKSEFNKESRARRPLAAAVSAIYRVTDRSCNCCCNILQNGKLKLSGCAVVSKGILVVEGGINSVKKLSNFMKSEPVEVIWQGRVARPIFGKFSVLHCNSDFTASKFFADHGALHYWNLAVKNSTLDKS